MKFKVSGFWRILSIFLIGALFGLYIGFKGGKAYENLNTGLQTNTNISIDKIKKSNIDNLEIKPESETTEKKKDKSFFKRLFNRDEEN
ncbi:MAG: hypothetical protein GF350_04785 [Chitinivibrionales bacterium]|nr:hypothetical protein [Chitinivibrionales bacterium]